MDNVRQEALDLLDAIEESLLARMEELRIDTELECEMDPYDKLAGRVREKCNAANDMLEDCIDVVQRFFKGD